MDDISSFLPPGYDPAAAAATEEADTKSTTEKAEEDQPFKLDISKLFSDVKTDEVASFLPPGYDPNAVSEETEPEAEKTTEKISLKFPTRPGSIKKVDRPPVRAKPSGPPPFVPKIKSFAER